MLTKMKSNYKSVIYMLCFFFLCVIDQRLGSVGGIMQFFWSNCVGFAFAIIILLQYNIKDFFKLKYLLWTVLCLILAPVSTILWKAEFPDCQWYTALANIIIYGYLIIRTIDFHNHHRWDKKDYFMPIFLCLSLLAMGLSRNDNFWPWYYLMVFGTLSFTNFDSKERKSIFNSLSNGILLGFFIIQGLGFVFRPYDVVRYNGMYANPNINALFYSIVYCAFLSKLIKFLFDKTMKCRIAGILAALFFCGGMWSFIVFTGCRSALISLSVTTAVAGILILVKGTKKEIAKHLALIPGLVLCIIITIPIVYGCIRYLPACFHHPIWFVNEYSEDKVHSFDPPDSEKYISPEEAFDYYLGRYFNQTNPDTTTRSIPTRSLPVSGETTTPVALKEHTNNSVEVRMLIWEYYAKKLNLFGHLQEEHGVQVTPEYYAPHTHNFILQFLFDFGILGGILPLLFIFAKIVFYTKKEYAQKDTSLYMILPLCGINLVSFGLSELFWRNGYLGLILFFMLITVSKEKHTH